MRQSQFDKLTASMFYKLCEIRLARSQIIILALLWAAGAVWVVPSLRWTYNTYSWRNRQTLSVPVHSGWDVVKNIVWVMLFVSAAMVAYPIYTRVAALFRRDSRPQ